MLRVLTERFERTRAACLIGRDSLQVFDSGSPLSTTPRTLGVRSALSSWQAAFDDALERCPSRVDHMTVIVDASLAPVIAVNASALALNRADWREFASQQMTELLGHDLADQFVIRAQRTPNHCAMISAMPAALVSTVHHGLPASVRSVSLQPALAWAAAQFDHEADTLVVSTASTLQTIAPARDPAIGTPQWFESSQGLASLVAAETRFCTESTVHPSLSHVQLGSLASDPIDTNESMRAHHVIDAMPVSITPQYVQAQVA